MGKDISSPIWNYFSKKAFNELYGICIICKQDVKRGSTIQTCSTTNLINHLKRHHTAKHNEFLQKYENVKLKQFHQKSRENQSKIRRFRHPSAASVTSSVPGTEDIQAASPFDKAADGRSVSCDSSTSFLDKRRIFEFPISQVSFPETRYTPNDDALQQKCSEALCIWICDQMQPCKTVEAKSFKNLIQALNSQYVLPSEKTIRQKMIPAAYEQAKETVREFLKEAEWLGATIDVWPNQGLDTFLSFTVHFVNREWSPKIAVLYCRPINVEHTSESLVTELEEVLCDWNLRNKLVACVTDDSCTILKALNEAVIPRASCILHTLQFVVKACLQSQPEVDDMITRATNCVSVLRNSNIAVTKLLEAQHETDTDARQLVSDQATWWSSIYLMLERLLDQRESVERVMEELQLRPHQKLNQNDWRLITRTLKLLQPFYQATMLVQRDDSFVSEVIPVIEKIRRQLSRLSWNDERSAGTLQEELLNALDQRFRNIDEHISGRQGSYCLENLDLYLKATYLDPRFKGNFYRDANQSTVKVQSLFLAEMCAAENDLQVCQSTPSPPHHGNKSKLWQFFSDGFDDESGTKSSVTRRYGASDSVSPEWQLSEYDRQPIICIDDCPLTWWKLNAGRFPDLARLARKYLCVPPSSVSLQQTFSLEGQIVSPTRTNLPPENIEKLLFLRCNLRVLGLSISSVGDFY